MDFRIKEGPFKYLKIVMGVLIGLDILVWFLILFPAGSQNLELYFLDVGQGDASLMRLSGGVKMLIDGGPPNGRLQKNLEKILPLNGRYLDLVMISHPQLDHFGGLIEVFKNYKIGAVLTSNQVSQQAAWQELERMIKEKEIQRIILAAGDKVKYQDSVFNILSPRDLDWAKDINDLALVAILNSGGAKVFFGGDISAEKERQLADLYDVDVDILKVSHHGSKYSSDLKFLKEATPSASVIEVGKNSYGHPTKEALKRLASFGEVYRTDRNGLLKLVFAGGKLNLYTPNRKF